MPVPRDCRHRSRVPWSLTRGPTALGQLACGISQGTPGDARRAYRASVESAPEGDKGSGRIGSSWKASHICRLRKRAEMLKFRFLLSGTKSGPTPLPASLSLVEGYRNFLRQLEPYRTCAPGHTTDQAQLQPDISVPKRTSGDSGRGLVFT